MVTGKDGYTALTVAEGAEMIVDEENGVLITTILRQYFLSLKVIGSWSHGGFYRNFFHGIKEDMKSKGSLVQSEAAQRREERHDDDDGSKSQNDGLESSPAHATEDEKMQASVKRMTGKWARLAGVKTGNVQDVDWTSCISPKVEGRIVEVKAERQ